MLCSLRFALCLLCLAIASGSSFASEWQVVKGEHFIVYHLKNAEFAELASRRAEDLYDKIRDDLGFAKRDDFWLWDDRVSIRVYATREDFLRATGSPQWASGSARFKKKEIATFSGNPDFLDSVLPHELAHLVLRDFVGFSGEIPLWLNEGVAQWEETDRRQSSHELVARMSAANRLIPLADLAAMDLRKVSDFGRAAEFYAESASLVGYLIRQHGRDRFRKLCGHLRDGKPLDEALRFTYPDAIRNIGELESAWKKQLNESRNN